MKRTCCWISIQGGNTKRNELERSENPRSENNSTVCWPL